MDFTFYEQLTKSDPKQEQENVHPEVLKEKKILPKIMLFLPCNKKGDSF